MRSKRRDGDDVGFDLDAAISVLHREALAAGAIPRADPRADDPRFTAIAHQHAFGDRGCERSPCRIAGICLALDELVTYRDEAKAGAPFIIAADATEEMLKAFDKAASRYVEVLGTFAGYATERHDVSGRRHGHQVMCVQPEQVVDDMTALRSSLETLERDLRGVLSSFQLQQRRGTKRSALLLTAVYQHLHWGGLTYAEIASLVPDDHGRRSAEERVRSRVKEPNARSTVPRELEDKLRKTRKPRATKPKAEKRARGGSSG